MFPDFTERFASHVAFTSGDICGASCIQMALSPSTHLSNVYKLHSVKPKEMVPDGNHVSQAHARLLP